MPLWKWWNEDAVCKRGSLRKEFRSSLEYSLFAFGTMSWFEASHRIFPPCIYEYDANLCLYMYWHDTAPKSLSLRKQISSDLAQCWKTWKLGNNKPMWTLVWRLRDPVSCTNRPKPTPSSRVVYIFVLLSSLITSTVYQWNYPGLFSLKRCYYLFSVRQHLLPSFYPCRSTSNC